MYCLDHVQQQVERPFEGLEEHLQRIGRDVQVARHLRDRLAVDHRERHLRLRGLRLELVGFELTSGVFDEFQFGLHR